MSRRILLVALTLSLALNVVLLQKQTWSPTPAPSIATSTPASDVHYVSGQSYPLLRVVDGDTIIVGVGSEAEYVRMIGVDTPEANSTGGPECYANEAAQKLKELVQVAGAVTLRFDTSQGLRDKYGRLLAYIELPDTTDVGEQMIRQGYAQEYTYDLPYERQARYKQAENDAMNAVTGLWDEAACAKK